MCKPVYAYQAALYCEPCANAIKARVPFPEYAKAESEDTWDSDDFPKGPYFDQASDTPDHCDACGEFLENPLTADGAEYVRQALKLARRGSVARTVWAPFYADRLDLDERGAA